MGSRDYRRREPKKLPKSVRKAPLTSISPPISSVEVIKTKGKKTGEEVESQ